jgi:hypothetical protein
VPPVIRGTPSACALSRPDPRHPTFDRRTRPTLARTQVRLPPTGPPDAGPVSCGRRPHRSGGLVCPVDAVCGQADAELPQRWHNEIDGRSNWRQFLGELLHPGFAAAANDVQRFGRRRSTAHTMRPKNAPNPRSGPRPRSGMRSPDTVLTCDVDWMEACRRRGAGRAAGRGRSPFSRELFEQVWPAPLPPTEDLVACRTSSLGQPPPKAPYVRGQAMGKNTNGGCCVPGCS